MCITIKRKFNLHLLIGIILIILNLGIDNVYAIGYILHKNSVLELQIAKDAPTRINIEGEKINDIFIHPKEAAEIMVHESGCLFILPQIGNNKIYVTLIGEDGTVQDLMLRFTGKNPSPIRLIKPDLHQGLTKKEEKNENKRVK